MFVLCQAIKFAWSKSTFLHIIWSWLYAPSQVGYSWYSGTQVRRINLAIAISFNIIDHLCIYIYIYIHIYIHIYIYKNFVDKSTFPEIFISITFSNSENCKIRLRYERKIQGFKLKIIRCYRGKKSQLKVTLLASLTFFLWH